MRISDWSSDVCSSDLRFGLAMAQRIDILVGLPKNAGAWPILAMREGARQQTGIILATASAHVGKLANMADTMAGPLNFDLERRLSALPIGATSRRYPFHVEADRFDAIIYLGKDRKSTRLNS